MPNSPRALVKSSNRQAPLEPMNYYLNMLNEEHLTVLTYSQRLWPAFLPLRDPCCHLHSEIPRPWGAREDGKLSGGI